MRKLRGVDSDIGGPASAATAATATTATRVANADDSLAHLAKARILIKLVELAS